MGKNQGASMVSSSDIPQRYRDFVDENLALAGTIANRNPNIPYTNPDGTPAERIAPFSPDQNAAFGVVRG